MLNRLIYVHNTTIQIPSANAVQTMNMCEAFRRHAASVELRFPGLLVGNQVPLESLHEYYGVEATFEARPLSAPFTPALMRSPAYLPVAKALAYSLDAMLRDSRVLPDVVFTRCATAAASMRRIYRWFGRAHPRVVFEAHEYPRDRKRALALRQVDAVVAITDVLAAELQFTLGLAPERVLVAPDGVRASWLNGMDKHDARSRLSLTVERPLVVFTGRLHPDLVPMLCETAEGLREVAELIAVGSAPDDPDGRVLAQIQHAAEQRRLPVRFTGVVPAEMARVYQAAADVLVAPYSGTLRWARYTSPLKVFEYMAAGRPMVISELPVLHEVLEHDVSAWFVEPNSGSAIAEGVKALLRRPDVADRIAARASQEAPQYSWTERARRIVRFIDDLPPAAEQKALR